MRAARLVREGRAERVLIADGLLSLLEDNVGGANMLRHGRQTGFCFSTREKLSKAGRTSCMI